MQFTTNTTKTTYRRKYWINSLLHMGSFREDGFLLKLDYEYRFNKNTLEFNLLNYSAIFHISNYKRIN
ncbi:hypothetical protein ACFSUS_24615 [Spirosoma soli]|uniref:DUF2490 domain-containing protein n=1 Tax=Spirosoma soli TaxID=1770529 RepID=A0ABW5MBT4_9BACT